MPSSMMRQFLPLGAQHQRSATCKTPLNPINAFYGILGCAGGICQSSLVLGGGTRQGDPFSRYRLPANSSCRMANNNTERCLIGAA